MIAWFMKWPTHISNYRFNWSLDPTNLIHSKCRNLFNTHRNLIQCAPFRTNKLHVIELNGDRCTIQTRIVYKHRWLSSSSSVNILCTTLYLRTKHTTYVQLVIAYTENFLAKLFSFIECDPFRMTFSDWKSNGKFIGAVKWCH